MPTAEELRERVERARSFGYTDEQIRESMLRLGLARETEKPEEEFEPIKSVGLGEFALGLTPEAREAQKKAGRASIKFNVEALKDLVVSPATFLPGAALKLFGKAQTLGGVVESDLGRTGDYLMDIARASYERVIDAQGEFIASYPEEIQPLVAAASTLNFGLINTIPP